MVATLAIVPGKTLGAENSGKKNVLSRATLAIVRGETLGHDNSGRNNNISINKVNITHCKQKHIHPPHR